jgi:hypothetical protein
VPVPGEPYSFGVLEAAQALGDYQALLTHGRRALRVSLGRQIEAGLRQALAAVTEGGATPTAKKTAKKAAKKTSRKTAARKASRKTAAKQPASKRRAHTPANGARRSPSRNGATRRR